MTTRRPGTRAADRLRAVASAVVTVALVVALAAAVALTLVPKLLDGAALTVLTGSMVPTYDPGDVVVVRGVEDPARDVRVGDVVSFQPFPEDPTLITHRVVSKLFTSEGTRFVTRGDANGADDEPLRPEQIKAVAVYHVPWVGTTTLWLGQRRDAVVIAAAAALLVYAAVMLLRPERRRADAGGDGTAPAHEAAPDAPVVVGGAAEPPTAAAPTGQVRT